MRSLVPKKWREDAEHPLSSFQREMNRLMETFLGTSVFPEARGEWTPALDVAETENEIVVKAEVPGIDKKDIDVTIRGDRLTISGEKKDERKEKKDTYTVFERRHGCFSRTIALPADINVDAVEAEFKSGVLTIRLPKTEETKSRKISVKGEE